MKKQKLKTRHKYVRVDSKTTIVVSEDTPDDVARKNYLDNIERSFMLIQKSGSIYHKRKKLNLNKENEEDD